MPVEVVLVSDGVEVSDTPRGVAKQRVGKLVECADLSLISETTNLQKDTDKKINLVMDILFQVEEKGSLVPATKSDSTRGPLDNLANLYKSKRK